MSNYETHLMSYRYEGAEIHVYRELDHLFFTTPLETHEYLLYDIKISDLKRDPILNDPIKNELLGILSYT